MENPERAVSGSWAMQPLGSCHRASVLASGFYLQLCRCCHLQPHPCPIAVKCRKGGRTNLCSTLTMGQVFCQGLTPPHPPTPVFYSILKTSLGDINHYRFWMRKGNIDTWKQHRLYQGHPRKSCINTRTQVCLTLQSVFSFSLINCFPKLAMTVFRHLINVSSAPIHTRHCSG